MRQKIGVINLPVNRIHIELTNICNFSCEFCPEEKMNRSLGRMSTDMAEDIIKEIALYKIAKDVYFHVMGEPTLHPDLTLLSEIAAQKGLRVCITTNGSMLNKKLYRELKAAGVKQIFISLQTPDENSFKLRGTRSITFDDYAERILNIASEHINAPDNMELIIGFLSSPLRRLIIPIIKEISIADTTQQLRFHLANWCEQILLRAEKQEQLDEVMKQIKRVNSFRENVIVLGRGIKFLTRVLGDWKSVTEHNRIKARFGYCHGLQNNFGILYNGDYTYCCTDFDGKTTKGNFKNQTIIEYLGSRQIQRVVKGFRKFRVIEPYCQRCLGDNSIINSVVKQIGSIIYFKFLRRI